jgi:hypothetical protein
MKTYPREKVLEALVKVLKDGGFNSVFCDAITDKMVADADMPAAIIEEVTESLTRVTAGREKRIFRVNSLLVIDLQGKVKTETGKRNGSLSKYRNLMSRQLLRILANNPALVCQLEGETASEAHCLDCAASFEVSYNSEGASLPYCRALVPITVQFDEEISPVETTSWSEIDYEIEKR